MITLGARLYFGLSAVAILAAWILGLASGGSILGVLTFSWSGPVGDQFGFTVLTGLAAASFFLGVVTTAFRDADATAVIELTGGDELPATPPPPALSPWPLVAAVGATLLAIGVIVDVWLTGMGLFLMGISAVEWVVTNWSERLTTDPEANSAIRNRLMAPFETPLAAAFGIFLFVFFASRVLLAAPTVVATTLFALFAAAMLAVGAYLASRPKVSRSTITGALLVGALILIGGGIAGLASGEREFHHLGDTSQSTSPATNAGDTEE